MARANTPTLLSLDRFFQVIGYHPLHANGVVIEDIAPVNTCQSPLVQHGWQQSDRLGREEIAQLIASAEEILAGELGFYVAPKWTKYDAVQYIQSYRPNAYGGSGFDIRGRPSTVRSSKGYVVSGGVRSITDLGNYSVVYSDDDGDGYNETATITAAVTVTNTEEIALFYPGKLGAEEWQIRPINVSIVGGVATITARREQLVKAELLEAYDAAPAFDGLVDDNFLDNVDVYRVYNNPSQQVEFITDALDYCTSCNTGTCALCSFAVQYGCIRTFDSRNGLLTVSPATWDNDIPGFVADSWTLCRAPDRVNLHYLSGWRNRSATHQLITMDPMWERAVAYLAMALTDRGFCTCTSIEMQSRYWREDLGRSDTAGTFKISRNVLDNPFGTTRAAVYAWRLVRQHRIGEAVINA